ncbi:TATA box-binding protein-associated factor RNA polymerase I subunit D isoform 1-T2 [Anomaloglossus baeobatrachus]|uniref:TATA box-binding protein-associated factor RNA polymerase I subunit D n=1 Tax=Anomaloglossus baeobatrachus TaxID=238106 RepID=UPI003F4FBAE6
MIMDSSVASQMDHSATERQLNRFSGESSEKHFHIQATNGNSVQKPESENLSISGSSSGDDSLFQEAVSYTPTRARRKQTIVLSSTSTSDEPSVSAWSSRKLTLAQEIEEYLKNPYRRKRKRKIKKAKKKKPAKERKPKATIRKSRYSIPLEERKRRMIDQGIPFPVTPSKHLSHRQYFSYEQHVLGGFLNHIKDLKYENTLKKSLKEMSADEDLDDFHLRKYSYMDEDGSLSPISEPGENLGEDEAEEEVKVVEKSEFILDCQVPSKKKWQIK